MGIFLNILVIIIAVIAFLVLYYSNLKKDRKNQDFQLPFRNLKTEYESGEEIGVDKKIMQENSKEEIELSDMGRKSSTLPKENFTNEPKVQQANDKYPLKDNYGKNFIRLFTRDPYYLFAYWEINEERFYQNKANLRLYNHNNNNYNDITIDHQAKSWYLHAEPDNKYSVSIGYIKDGIYFPLASSKKARTSLDSPSNIVDEQWMTIEELVGYSFKFEMGSLSLIKNNEENREELEANSLTLVQK